MECDDADLAAAAQELMRSLETVGATVRLWPQTLQFNIPAKRQIVSLAPHERHIRARLVEAVKWMSGKKLHAAMARRASRLQRDLADHLPRLQKTQRLHPLRQRHDRMQVRQHPSVGRQP